MVADWAPRDVPLTTFSVMMAQHLSGGRLEPLARAAAQLDKLRAGDRVLICEACNHDRLTDTCDDIGTVQLPRLLARRAPGVVVEHACGREFPTDDLRRFALVVHCGGCMLDRQRMSARLGALEAAGVPVTNFGLLLSYAKDPAVLARVMAPYGARME